MAFKETCIIAVEIGTNAVRVVAFSKNGATLASMKGSYPTFHPQPDYSEQDPEQIFITMLYVLKNLLNEHIHPQKLMVSHICFSASMHSVLAIDKSGVPLGNAVIWADNRAKLETEKLRGTPEGKVIYEATGTPLHPMSPLFKIAWFRNNDKARYDQTSKFIQLKTYIIHQLTGAKAVQVLKDIQGKSGAPGTAPTSSDDIKNRFFFLLFALPVIQDLYHVLVIMLYIF